MTLNNNLNPIRSLEIGKKIIRRRSNGKIVVFIYSSTQRSLTYVEFWALSTKFKKIKTKTQRFISEADRDIKVLSGFYAKKITWKWKGRSDHTFATTKDLMHRLLTAKDAPDLGLGRRIGRLGFLGFLIRRRGWIAVDLLFDLLNEALSWHARFLDLMLNLIRHELPNVIRRHNTRRRFLCHL